MREVKNFTVNEFNTSYEDNLFKSESRNGAQSFILQLTNAFIESGCSEHERNIYHLFFRQGYSHERIAEELNTTANRSRSVLHKVQKKLKAFVESVTKAMVENNLIITSK